MERDYDERDQDWAPSWSHADVHEERAHWAAKLEPYRRRHVEITEKARADMEALRQLFGNDLVPPSSRSGILWYFRLSASMIGWLLALVLALGLCASFTVKSEYGPWACGVAGMIIQIVIVAVGICVSLFMCVTQGHIFYQLRDVAANLDCSIPLLPASDMARHHEEDLSMLMVDHQCSGSKARWSTPFCGCGPQRGGHYELDGYGWRRFRVTSAQLMKQYYWTEYLEGQSIFSCSTLLMVVGVVQFWDLLLNCLQPGLMCSVASGFGETSKFLKLVHAGWCTFCVMILLGCIQVGNCRYLLQNALGTSTAEKEWLAHDVSGGPHQAAHPSWHDAIGLTDQEYLGHLNITYAWMSLEAAAETCGMLHLANLARGLAQTTQDMIQENTPYQFRLKDFAEWDLKKVGVVVRVIQSMLLTFLNVEYFGTTYQRACLTVQVFTLVCIFISLGTALWKAGIALSFFGLSGIEVQSEYTYPGLYRLRRPGPFPVNCRKCGIRAVVSFVVGCALISVFTVGLGAYAYFNACGRRGFSLLESAHGGQWHCWDDTARVWQVEAVAWNSGADELWLVCGGLVFGVGWLWLAYWGWWSTHSCM